MKLFLVKFKETWENGFDHCSQLFIAENQTEAEGKVEKILGQKKKLNRDSGQYSIKISNFYEVNEVEGYKISVH
jgi:hypothetical protein